MGYFLLTSKGHRFSGGWVKGVLLSCFFLTVTRLQLFPCRLLCSQVANELFLLKNCPKSVNLALGFTIHFLYTFIVYVILCFITCLFSFSSVFSFVLQSYILSHASRNLTRTHNYFPSKPFVIRATN